MRSAVSISEVKIAYLITKLKKLQKRAKEESFTLHLKDHKRRTSLNKSIGPMEVKQTILNPALEKTSESATIIKVFLTIWRKILRLKVTRNSKLTIKSCKMTYLSMLLLAQKRKRTMVEEIVSTVLPKLSKRALSSNLKMRRLKIKNDRIVNYQ
jgi:hypothetical protein